MIKWCAIVIILNVEYANEANRFAHSAENLYKLGTRLELSRSEVRTVRPQRPGAYLTYITKHKEKSCNFEEALKRRIKFYAQNNYAQNQYGIGEPRRHHWK